MTGSGNNGMSQSVKPAVDANHVFAYVGDTRKPNDVVYGNGNGMEDQPKSSMTDEKFIEERAMGWIDAPPNSWRHMKFLETTEVVTRGATMMVIVLEV